MKSVILYDLTLIETFEENKIISALDFDNWNGKLAIFFARTLVVAHVVSRSWMNNKRGSLQLSSVESSVGPNQLESVQFGLPWNFLFVYTLAHDFLAPQNSVFAT